MNVKKSFGWWLRTTTAADYSRVTIPKNRLGDIWGRELRISDLDEF
jgi:hypothetical protein